MTNGARQVCPAHGPQVGYRYGGPDGPLVCAVPSRDGGMCHRLLKPQNTVRQGKGST